jgi:hypothetical protein
VSFFDGFWKWLLAVLDHWELLAVSGIVPFFNELADKIWDRRMPRKVYIWFAIIALVLATFAAWKDEQKRADSEHTKIDQLQKQIDDLTKPEFSMVAPESAIGYDEKRKMSLLWLAVGITNRGAPSIAGGWKLDLDSPRMHTRVGFSQLPPMPRSVKYVGNFTDEDAIYEKTFNKPLEKGGAEAGWAYFEIPGKAAYEELDKGTVVFHLICYDYLNREHRSEAIHMGQQAEGPQYYPGMKHRFYQRRKSP